MQKVIWNNEQWKENEKCTEHKVYFNSIVLNNIVSILQLESSQKLYEKKTTTFQHNQIDEFKNRKINAN